MKAALLCLAVVVFNKADGFGMGMGGMPGGGGLGGLGGLAGLLGGLGGGTGGEMPSDKGGLGTKKFMGLDDMMNGNFGDLFKHKGGKGGFGGGGWTKGISGHTNHYSKGKDSGESFGKGFGKGFGKDSGESFGKGFGKGFGNIKMPDFSDMGGKGKYPSKGGMGGMKGGFGGMLGNFGSLMNNMMGGSKGRMPRGKKESLGQQSRRVWTDIKVKEEDVPTMQDEAMKAILDLAKKADIICDERDVNEDGLSMLSVCKKSGMEQYKQYRDIVNKAEEEMGKDLQ